MHATGQGHVTRSMRSAEPIGMCGTPNENILKGSLRFPPNSGQGFKQLSLFLSGSAHTGRG